MRTLKLSTTTMMTAMSLTTSFDHDENKSSLDIDKVLSVVDEDRMDILETLVRVTMVETEMILLDGVSALRMWEHLVRSKLAIITSPGQLFSPLEIPEEW